MEHNKIDRNELQIRTNLQKGTGTKMAKKLKILKNLKGKKNRISALFSTQRLPDDWPDVLDHLAIGLVANKYTKQVKTCYLVRGCPIKKSHCAISTLDYQ